MFPGVVRQRLPLSSLLLLDDADDGAGCQLTSSEPSSHQCRQRQAHSATDVRRLIRLCRSTVHDDYPFQTFSIALLDLPMTVLLRQSVVSRSVVAWDTAAKPVGAAAPMTYLPVFHLPVIASGNSLLPRDDRYTPLSTLIEVDVTNPELNVSGCMQRRALACFIQTDRAPIMLLRPAH